MAQKHQHDDEDEFVPLGDDEGDPREGEDGIKGYWSLLISHFENTLTTGVLLLTLILLVTERYLQSPGLANFTRVMVGLLFVLPIILCAGWAGTLADRFNKRVVVLASKLIMVLVALGALGALFLYSATPEPGGWRFLLLLLTVPLVGLQNAFFSPARYGLIPELLPENRTTWANGWMLTATFAAMILALFLVSTLYVSLGAGNVQVIGFVLFGLAVAGVIAALFLPTVDAANSEADLERNPFPAVWENVRTIIGHRMQLVAALGLVYFWSLTVVFLINAPFWGEMALGIGIPDVGEAATWAMRFLASFQAPVFFIGCVAAGIAIGATLAGNIPGRGMELGFVPLGGLALALFSVLLGLAAPDYDELRNPQMGSITAAVFFIVTLILTGVSAGFFGVPLAGLLQRTAPPKATGGIIAASNFMNFSGIALSVAFYLVLVGFFHFQPGHVFVLSAVATLAVTVMLVISLPEIALGLMATLVTRFMYRTEVKGEENFPREGPALLVCNHVSLLDALVVSYISPRPVKFLVWQELYDSPIVGRFLKAMDAIPIPSDMRPRLLISALMTASNALNRGEVVCIFAPGQQLAARGVNLPFRRGFNRILTKAPAPVIPIYLSGVWGSIFSYERRKFIWSFPNQFHYPVQAAIGKPLPADVSVDRLRLAVQELSAECAMEKKDQFPPLHHTFIERAREQWNQFCVDDTVRKPNLKCGRTLVASILLARRLRKAWAGQKMVGIYLPPMAASVLANIAASLSGRVAVNLNYTTGRDVLEHCIKQCDLKTVLTSKLFLARLGQEPPPGAIFIEDYAPAANFAKNKPATWGPTAKLTLGEMLPALALAKWAPIRTIEKACGAEEHPTPDSLATIIFSSGSTGIPKGIMLSHFNVASNVWSFGEAVSLWSDDKMLGILPFFHSFGYTVSLWGSLIHGYGAVHHANPLEAKVIGDAVEAHGITLLVATPTFLQTYIRRIEPEKFRTLEFVLTGAEKLPEKVAVDFEEKFGVEVLEGYGTSECSPVVSTNVDSYRDKGHHQICSKRGTVGRPLPGIAVKIVDPDTGKDLQGDQPGMILVRGPNIMQGYLHMPEKTAEVIKDGWYETGDIGFVDGDGFIHITDRLARFSKIGGEMVPHQRIEEELHELFGESDRAFAVTGVPDEHKGERLSVVTTYDLERLEGVTQKLQERGLPNIWIPKRDMFFHVEEIPILGTGKMDLSRVRAMAKENVQEKEHGTQAEVGSSGAVVHSITDEQ